MAARKNTTPKRTYKKQHQKERIQGDKSILIFFFLSFFYFSFTIIIILFFWSCCYFSLVHIPKVLLTFFHLYLDEIWTEMLKYQEKSSCVNFPELALQGFYCGNTGFWLFFCVCVCVCECVLFNSVLILYHFTMIKRTAFYTCDIKLPYLWGRRQFTKRRFTWSRLKRNRMKPLQLVNNSSQICEKEQTNSQQKNKDDCCGSRSVRP